MAGTRIRSFAKLRSQIPRIATTGITPWQTALKWTADCQAPNSGCQEYMRSGQACGNPLSNWYFFLWQSAVWLFCSWRSLVYTPRIVCVDYKLCCILYIVAEPAISLHVNFSLNFGRICFIVINHTQNKILYFKYCPAAFINIIPALNNIQL
jgi:hypothetical protein